MIGLDDLYIHIANDAFVVSDKILEAKTMIEESKVSDDDSFTSVNNYSNKLISQVTEDKMKIYDCRLIAKLKVMLEARVKKLELMVNQKTKSIKDVTRPSSDSEAATMYKLKGQSSNMRTGQSFK